jgi:hypothetical protein
MTRPAGFFDITRAEWRPWGTGKLGILLPPALKLKFVRTTKSECLDPMFDRRVEPDAQDIIRRDGSDGR